MREKDGCIGIVQDGSTVFRSWGLMEEKIGRYSIGLEWSCGMPKKVFDLGEKGECSGVARDER